MDKQTRHRWRSLEKQVAAVVNAVDPLDLLGLDAPSDEYETQVAQILSAYLKHGSDIEALTQATQDTFDKWFGGPSSIPLAKSRLIASRLCDVLPPVDTLPTK